MPSKSVSPSSGQLLTLLASMAKAKHILEIGALGGYSGICLLRGTEQDGTLTSLELQESYAELAKNNVSKAGFGDRVSYRTGPALDSLSALESEGKRFDFFFIDADKESYPAYLEACIRLAEQGAVIVADNVLAGGSVADAEVKTKRYTEIMKQFNQVVAEHPQLESILIPMGDGLTVSKVKK